MTATIPLSPMEQIVVDDVRERGCHLMPIFDPSGAKPNYLHSIGFWESIDQPEAIVFGLRDELMGSMLSELHRQCLNGLQMADGLSVVGLLDGFDCILKRIADVDIIHDHFGWAVWYRHLWEKPQLEEAFQVVWPGAKQGLFPWEVGCDKYVIEYQPALYGTGDA